MESAQVAANIKVNEKDGTNPSCQLGASDFVFVMDQSGSIGTSDYLLGKTFAADLTRDMTIGSGDQVSLNALLTPCRLLGGLYVVF